MTGWRPIDREPDPLRAAIHDYLRTRAADVYLDPRSGTHGLGRVTVIAGHGRAITIELALMPAEVIDYTSRPAVSYAVAGHAADGEMGYEIQGRVVIDRQTLAYLLIEAVPRVVRTGR